MLFDCLIWFPYPEFSVFNRWRLELGVEYLNEGSFFDAVYQSYWEDHREWASGERNLCNGTDGLYREG
jgi:hypothetical protein